VILKLSDPPEPTEEKHWTFESVVDTTQDDPLNTRGTIAVPGEYVTVMGEPVGPRSRPSMTICAPPIVDMAFVNGSVEVLAVDKYTDEMLGL